MRIKDEKFYAQDGKRRSSSRYIYLGTNDKCALTWYIHDNGNSAKYAIVFDNNIDMRRYMKDNPCHGMSIEYKHVCMPRDLSDVIDYRTGEPVDDYYKIDNVYHKVNSERDRKRKLKAELEEINKLYFDRSRYYYTDDSKKARAIEIAKELGIGGYSND